MKKVMCLIALGGLIFLMGSKKQANSSVKVDKDAAVIKEVLAAHLKIVEAAQKLDADKMFSYILKNDKTTIMQDGQVMTYQEAFEQTSMGFESVVGIKYHFKQKNVKMLSPTTALFTGIGTTELSSYSGRITISKFANTLVFVLKDGQWKIIHGHYSTPIPQ